MLDAMQNKLSQLTAEITAFRETYKQELKDTAPGASDELQQAQGCLEDAIFFVNKEIEDRAEEEDEEGRDTQFQHEQMESRMSRFI